MGVRSHAEMIEQVRKTIHNLLNVNAARSYLPYQMLENKQMLHDMLKQPDDFLEHVRRYSNSLTTSLVYGYVGSHERLYRDFLELTGPSVGDRQRTTTRT